MTNLSTDSTGILLQDRQIHYLAPTLGFGGKRRAVAGIAGDGNSAEPAHDYLSRSAILATAAWAQTSSLSPPGAPPTPIAPTTSSPDLINTPPGTRKTPGRCCSGPKAGPLLTLATIALVVDSLKLGPSETAA